MPSRFAEFERDVSAACNDEFGEEIAIIRRGGSGPFLNPASDAAPIIVVGIVDDEVGVLPTRGERSSDGDRADMGGPRSEVSIATEALTVEVGRGDRVRLIARPGQPYRRVTFVAPDGAGRTVLTLIPE